MAPKDDKQRINEGTMKASYERLRQVESQRKSGQDLPMPTDLEYAVMRLRSAAYALRPGQDYDKTAAFALARDAFVLADAAFSKDDKRLFGVLVTTMPETVDGLTQQVERVQVKHHYETIHKDRVLFAPWMWLKLKLRGKPTFEEYTDGTKTWPK